jgi:mannan endo-1,4-beta-mannosidase
MVSVGDEGFLNRGGDHFAYRANDGVDHEALTAQPAIDFGTFHLYPEDWGATLEWGETWIDAHLRVARKLGKPTVLEEYGVKVTRSRGNVGEIIKGWPERQRAYHRWNEIMLRRGGNGALPWILSGIDADERRYPDYDQYAFYADDATGRLLGAYAKKFNEGAPACEAAGPSTGSTSPYVRVRRPPSVVALGWAEASKG